MYLIERKVVHFIRLGIFILIFNSAPAAGKELEKSQQQCKIVFLKMEENSRWPLSGRAERTA